MTDHIKLTPAPGRYTIRAGDTVIGETDRAISLVEGGGRPVLYVPRDAVKPEYLDRTDRQTGCPWKGTASYFSVVTPAGRLDNAVWSYETPKAGLEAIAGHLAFYPSVTVTPA
jgi:uncharacterized protein (DUF427 family)